MNTCEQSLGLLPAPSLVLDTVCSQLQDHRVNTFSHRCWMALFIRKYFFPYSLSVWQVLLSEVNDYGEAKNSLKNTAHRLTEMSRKEDCDVIHNLIMAVQDRYKKLQQRVAERGRMLEDVKKNSRQV